MLGSFRKTSQKEMAHNNKPTVELSNQMTLPPIRRICSIAQEANDISPLRFLKLPRLERRPVVKSKTPLFLQEKEQKNESYKSYVAIDKNFTPLQAATKQGTCSLERWRGFKDAQRFEESHVHVHKLRRPVQLLRRRLKPNKVYQQGDSQMSYDELLSFEQNLDQLRTFTERDKMMVLRDFTGENLEKDWKY